MRNVSLMLAFLIGIGGYVYAQNTTRPSLSLELTGDIVTTTPVNGYDGVIRTGRAQYVTTASGNVLIVINGIQVTADSAVWRQDTNEIELAGGRARIQLP